MRMSRTVSLDTSSTARKNRRYSLATWRGVLEVSLKHARDVSSAFPGDALMVDALNAVRMENNLAIGEKGMS